MPIAIDRIKINKPLRPLIVTSQPVNQFNRLAGQLAGEAATEAKRIAAGIYDRGKIKEEEGGYKILDYGLAQYLASATIPYSGREKEARIDLISSLRTLGYEVVVLVPSRQSALERDEEFIKSARLAGANRIVGIKEDVPCVMTWPRDNFVQIGSALFTDRGLEDTGWFEGLGVKARIRSEGLVAEGGKLILGDGFALFSALDLNYEAIRRGAAAHFRKLGIATRRILQEIGFKTYSLPSAWADIFPRAFLDQYDLRKRFLVRDDHIDRAVMVLRNERVIALDAQYYAENREALDPVVEEIGYRSCQLPDRMDLSCNSLELPNGGVLMDGACREAREILAPLAAGHTTRGSYGDFGAGGGIRCATNILWIEDKKAA